MLTAAATVTLTGVGRSQVIIITGPTSVCETYSYIYTATTGYAPYTWSVTGGTFPASTANSITVTWTPSGPGLVSVSCSGGTATLPVTVNPLPIPTITGPTFVSAGTTLNLYTTQTGMTNYVWSVSAGGSVTAGGGPGNNTVTVTWNTFGHQVVCVNYSDPNDCSAQNPTCLDVIVNPVGIPENDPTSSDIQIYSKEKSIYVDIPDEIQGEITIFNILGQKITSAPVLGKHLNRIDLEKGGGYFIVQVKSDKEVVAGKVFIR